MWTDGAYSTSSFEELILDSPTSPSPATSPRILSFTLTHTPPSNRPHPHLSPSPTPSPHLTHTFKQATQARSKGTKPHAPPGTKRTPHLPLAPLPLPLPFHVHPSPFTLHSPLSYLVSGIWCRGAGTSVFFVRYGWECGCGSAVVGSLGGRGWMESGGDSCKLSR